MAKTTPIKKEKIISALSLWREYDVTRSLEALTIRDEQNEESGFSYTVLSYNGRATEDGGVRIFAYFARPSGGRKCPAILLLKEAGKPMDVELMQYFVQKGYAVLMPDYSGSEDFCVAEDPAPKGRLSKKEVPVVPQRPVEITCTYYPPSVAYANYACSQGMYHLDGISANKTCWFEWTYVALYSLKYLRFRYDVTDIGVVGVRTGGEVAWKVMLSSDVACGVTVNSAGWLSAKSVGRFSDGKYTLSTDERHRYIAGVDSQSYAPFVKCPVLMLCAMSDYEFDYDRAYDTYGRIGGEHCDAKNAIVYSADSGSCIGSDGLVDMQLFLDCHLKGREVFIPKPLNIQVNEVKGKLQVTVTGDEEGILSEMGICYAEADPSVRSIYREWQCVYKKKGSLIKDGKLSYEITPFAGTSASYVYAYARYLNGFQVVSKVVAKHFNTSNVEAEGSRMLFSGKGVDCFSVAQHEDYSVAGIFLEKSAQPKLVEGYGGVKGAYSVGGIKTYKISSPQYVAKEGAMLKFDAYCRQTDELEVGVEVPTEDGGVERFFTKVPVRGGGKWKRIILEAKDLKSEICGKPLTAFALGRSLAFRMEKEESEYAITNILWL